MWTLNKATDDILLTLDRIEKYKTYPIDGMLRPVEEASIINMKETKEHHVFTLKLKMEMPVTVKIGGMDLADGGSHAITKVKDTITIDIKYRKKKKELMADWNDDD